MASGIVEQPSQNSESEQQQEQQQRQQDTRSKLVQRLLAASPDLPAFINDLITAQAVSVAGTEAVGFLLEKKEQEVMLKLLAHVRPDGAAENVRQQAIGAFQELVKPCLEQQKDGAIEVGPAGEGETQFCLVTLLRSDTTIIGVSAVITKCLDTERAKQRLMSMQLVAGYFEMFTLKRNTEQSRAIAISHQHVLQAATSVATSEGFEAAAKGLCNELATRIHAARVSIGWRKGENIKLRAVSHTEKFDKKQELVIALQRVMEECADQEVAVFFDPTGEPTDTVTREAQSFSRANGGNSVLSLPLRRAGEVEGVIVIELLPQQKIDQSALQGLTIAADLLAPQLYDRHENDRWLITKAGLSIKRIGEDTIGPKFMLAKVITVAILAAVLFVFLYKPMYHVSANFQFVADAKRIISAPMDNGRIAAVYKRPGDSVKKGDVLMELDATELIVQKAQSDAEADQYRKEMIKDRASSDHLADADIAEAEMDKAQAESNLLQLKINQCRITAPIDGKVLTGDWWHKIQAPVKEGDELFEIASDGPLRAELQVVDRDIQSVHVGQVGKLATTSLPTSKYGFKVQTVVGNGQPVEGENVFPVYANIPKQSSDWLPGMEGEARIDIGPRSLAWIWTHRLMDYLRMKFWM
ncbi:MAG TPA: HlyD family efflux transporter periplasmic adaptor subunit [Tepidisphaeraceae bacterium]|nr:HlyD family efflux transporter periplasmic adaptor subunit [Tepidisphaeraceae bacterium]